MYNGSISCAFLTAHHVVFTDVKLVCDPESRTQDSVREERIDVTWTNDCANIMTSDKTHRN